MMVHKNKMTMHSGVSLLPEATVLYEVYRDSRDKIHLHLETLKKSQPIPILLYNRSHPYKKLMLDGALIFAISELESGSYEIRTAGDEIFRFVLG